MKVVLIVLIDRLERVFGRLLFLVPLISETGEKNEEMLKGSEEEFRSGFFHIDYSPFVEINFMQENEVKDGLNE
jgi:hypothetical protein